MLVAFDLDMTLVDSSAGIVSTQLLVAEEFGYAFDPAELRARVGVPVGMLYAERMPPSLVPTAVARYRELYPTTGVPSVVALPGAAEALAAVRARGGRTAVVSAKVRPAVEAVLAHVGLEVDAIAGDVFAAAKGRALRELRAGVMVGDHPGDMEGARVAGAVAVGVTTGPNGADGLRAAGADVVLPDLRGFPAWLDEALPAAGARTSPPG